jgi:hypothetical protein
VASAPDAVSSGGADPGDQAKLGVAWARWWGSKDLVYRIADTSRNAVSTDAREAVKLDVAVFVRQDRERFTTPNGFRYRITGQAVREWDFIGIRATGSDLEVWVRISRRRRRVPAAYYPGGRFSEVVMGVTSLCAHVDPVPVRDKIEKVVERGVPAGTRRKQRVEFTGATSLPIKLKGFDAWFWGPALAGYFLGAVAFVGWVVWSVYVPDSYAAAIGLGAVGGIVGLLVVLLLRPLIPEVAFSDREGRPPLTRVASIVVCGALSPLVAALVKVALGFVGVG